MNAEHLAQMIADLVSAHIESGEVRTFVHRDDDSTFTFDVSLEGRSYSLAITDVTGGESTLALSPNDWETLVHHLDSPPRAIPELRRLWDQ